MRKLSIIIFVLAAPLLACACSAGAAKTAEPPTANLTAHIADYFPADDNIKLIYQGEGSEYASYTVYTDYTDGGRFVVSLHLDLWTKNMGARVSTGDFNAYAPLDDFKGETIARAATSALGRVTPKVVEWLDQGLPKLQKALEHK